MNNDSTNPHKTKLVGDDLTVRCSDLGNRYAALHDNLNAARPHCNADMVKINAKSIDIGKFR